MTPRRQPSISAVAWGGRIAYVLLAGTCLATARLVGLSLTDALLMVLIVLVAFGLADLSTDIRALYRDDVQEGADDGWTE